MSKRGENIYRRKDGRWEGRYPKGRKTDGTIHYGYIYGRSYKKVKEEVSFLRAHHALKSNQTRNLYQGTTKEWVTYWLEEVIAPRVKVSTYVSYTNKLSIHFTPDFGEQTLQSITNQAIEDWLKQLRKKLALSTVHTIFRIVKGCFKYAKKRKMIMLDPTQNISLPILSVKKPKAFSVMEQKKLMENCQQHVKSLPIMIALETGMRVGEICGLKWADIDFDQKVIHVCRTVQRLTDYSQSSLKTFLKIGTPKTSQSERIIPLSERLKAVLIEGRSTVETDYFVLSNTNKPMEPRTISYRFKQLKKSLDLPNYPFHTLRHTFATRCVEMGVNIAAISSLLGHTSTKMTLDVYTGSFMTDQRLAVENLAIL